MDLADVDGPLPAGTVIDATRGRVELVTALPGGGTQTGHFWGTRFTVGQTSATGMVDLRIDATLDCRRPRAYPGPPEPTPITAQERIHEAAAAPRRRVLWGRDKGGRFRTHGRDSVATVRGTQWTTTVTCTGTTTRVTEGAVSVRDLRTRRTVLVKAGQAYTARRR